jgi:RNA polymerase sigma-70 factor, ECF subfamily
MVASAFQEGRMDESLSMGRPEEAAWEGLEEMRASLHAFLVRQCPDENDIEDVIQETFLRAARYRRAHRVKKLRPWAMRIALNVLADARRRVVRTQAEPTEGDFDPPARPPTGPADSAFFVGREWLDGEAARELLLGGLGTMREGDRALLDSFYGGDLCTASAAQACGLPQRLVKVRLYRARQRLLRALRRRAARETHGRLCAS